MSKRIKEVLIIDDDPISSKLVNRFLPTDEFNAVEVSCISEAVEYLLENTPHIIFLDIMLPEMSGLEFQQECKDLIPKESILIMLSSRTEKKVIHKAMQNGAADYIIKPATRNTVMTAVKKHLKGQSVFSKDFLPNEMLDCTMTVQGELKALGETDLLIHSPIKFESEEKIRITGKVLSDIGFSEDQFIVNSKYLNKVSSAKYTGVTFRGASNKIIKNIRGMIIHWNKLFD